MTDSRSRTTPGPRPVVLADDLPGNVEIGLGQLVANLGRGAVALGLILDGVDKVQVGEQ